MSKELNDYLIKHNTTHLNNQNNSFPTISVGIEAKEAHHEYIALKVNNIKRVHFIYKIYKYTIEINV